MKPAEKFKLLITCPVIALMVFVASSCSFGNKETHGSANPDRPIYFPEFITPVAKYYEIRIAGNHSIDGYSYRLKISGAVNKTASLSLEELSQLEMIEKPVTIECIENPPNGNLLSTAMWKGFSVYGLLADLGIKEGATTVKYICSDGYYTYNSLEELKNREVIGALFMNSEPIPEKYGYPLRVIFPGYFGVRQPGWVVEMEVMETPVVDYWSNYGWKTDSPMDIDSRIFFPEENAIFPIGESIRIGGCAYGRKRISSVDVTFDGGISWVPAIIKQDMNEDYVWVFWEIEYKPTSAGEITIYSMATSLDGRIQPRSDKESLDGTNSWPSVTISVEDNR